MGLVGGHAWLSLRGGVSTGNGEQVCDLPFMEGPAAKQVRASVPRKVRGSERWSRDSARPPRDLELGSSSLRASCLLGRPLPTRQVTSLTRPPGSELRRSQDGQEGGAEQAVRAAAHVGPSRPAGSSPSTGVERG